MHGTFAAVIPRRFCFVFHIVLCGSTTSTVVFSDRHSRGMSYSLRTNTPNSQETMIGEAKERHLFLGRGRCKVHNLTCVRKGIHSVETRYFVAGWCRWDEMFHVDTSICWKMAKLVGDISPSQGSEVALPQSCAVSTTCDKECRSTNMHFTRYKVVQIFCPL